jgi:hypothetical protein
MKITENRPPRRFVAGKGDMAAELKDCARIDLEPGEQVTFVAAGGKEYDVCRKEWGFYATPSTNARLAGFDLRAALVLNAQGRVFVMLVERERQAAFHAYCAADGQRVLSWLDDPRDIEKLVRLTPEANAPEETPR